MNRRDSSSKVTDSHLRRKAYVYIRQSTLQQVSRNQESQVNQRQMVARAAELGWPAEEIEVIDEDQGLSGSESERRTGFQRLVAEVSMGRAGIVVGYEVSRLARNNGDWYHLLDLAAVFDTLIADNDGVYHPAQFNDRLLLGLKGTMSEAELHILKQRLEAGRLRQVERGVYRQPLPTGLVRATDGRVEKDPDGRICGSIELVLAKFGELGSCGKVLRYLRQEGLLLPRRQMCGPERGKVVWKPPSDTAIYEIVRNPAYAGAFVYGRRQHTPGRPSCVRRRQPPAEWIETKHDVYPAYISWAQYEANQAQLARNGQRAGGAEPAASGVAREGPGLLQGLVVCGHCGYHRQVMYKEGYHHYPCQSLRRRHGLAACPTIHGPSVDEAVSQAFFAALRPANLDVLETVLAAQRVEQERLAGQWLAQVQQAEYEAQRAQRQYMQVEPENRLVAAELERRWEEKLQQQRRVEEAAQRWHAQNEPAAEITAEMREQFAHLAAHLPAVWARCTPAQRKTLLRSLIERVIVRRDVADRVSVRIVWLSGHYTDLEVQTPVGLQTSVSRYAAMVERVGELYAEGLDDAQIAAQLSSEGFHSAHRSDVAVDAVTTIRRAQRWLHRTGPRPAMREGYLTLPALATRLGVERQWVYRRLRNGGIEPDAVVRDLQTHQYLIQDDPELIARLQAEARHHLTR
jgi:DNA invertase Pin-like site-specific DNA recombinase